MVGIHVEEPIVYHTLFDAERVKNTPKIRITGTFAGATQFVLCETLPYGRRLEHLRRNSCAIKVILSITK